MISQLTRDTLIFMGLTLSSFHALRYFVDLLKSNKWWAILVIISLIAVLVFGSFAVNYSLKTLKIIS